METRIWAGTIEINGLMNEKILQLKLTAKMRVHL